jgi:hypothetical protein
MPFWSTPILECQYCPCLDFWTQVVAVLGRKLRNSPKKSGLLFKATWLCESFWFALARSDAPSLNQIDYERITHETMSVRDIHRLLGVVLDPCWAYLLLGLCIHCLDLSNPFDRKWGLDGEFGWKFLCWSFLRMEDSRTKEWKESLLKTKYHTSCHSRLSTPPARRRKVFPQQCAYVDL